MKSTMRHSNAFVVAESFVQARDVAELINFAYEVLPAEAIGPGRDRAESNVSFYIESGKRTAVDAALADGSSRRQP
jgi:hypothetical protein